MQVIEGYASSLIAKQETNDCVVRAIAVLEDRSYDSAHTEARLQLNRRNRSGVKLHALLNWLENVRQYKRVITEQPPNSIGRTPKTVYTNKKTGQKTFCRMSVGSFLKLYPTGKYYVIVPRHIFAVVNGEVLGNVADAQKLRILVDYAFKVD